MIKIADIRGREILDSRGNPTVEADVTPRWDQYSPGQISRIDPKRFPPRFVEFLAADNVVLVIWVPAPEKLYPKSGEQPPEEQPLVRK